MDDITKSQGYIMLKKCEGKMNYKIGSIIRMKTVYNSLMEKIKDFQSLKDKKNNAGDMAKYCLTIREVVLPEIMKGRVFTEPSINLYNNISYACSFLLDDFQTWWDISIH